MTAETVPGSVAWDDNTRIAFVPNGSNALSVAILAGGTVKDLTYSLKSFNRTIAEATIEDPRLTLKQTLQKRGKVTESLELQYVFGDAADVAYTALTPGVKGSLVVRHSIPNSTAWTIGQKVDVITIEAGVQRKDAPVENGVQTVTQTLMVTNVTQTDALLIA
jgi:hypothetical protein